MARRQEDHQKVFIGGMLEQNVSNCLRLLDRFLKQDQPIVASTLVDKRTHKGKNLFDEVTHIMGTLKSVTNPFLSSMFFSGLTNLKCVSMQATFPELGMDSIMVIEIKQTLEREYEVFLTVQGIRSLTLAKYNLRPDNSNCFNGIF